MGQVLRARFDSKGEDEMRSIRVLGLTVASCGLLAAFAAPGIAKDPKLIGPINQSPQSLGQATVELKVHYGHKSHGSKKMVPKSLLAKEHNLYFTCLDGQVYYPGGGGDASQQSKVDFEETIRVKKNKTFGVTDTTVGDTNTGSISIQGKIVGRTASGTIRMENHENDGSRPPGDVHTCDSGVLSWTASAP